MLHQKKWAISVFLCTSLFIPLYVRVAGGITFYVYLSLFVFCYAFLVRGKKNHSNNTGVCCSGKKIKHLLTYIVIIQVLFVFLGTEVSVFHQVSQMKSMVAYALLFVSWNLVTVENYKGVFKSVSFSLLIVFLYGYYSYLTASNPYVDYMIGFFGEENDFASKMYRYLGEQRGGIKTRITGVTYNPLQFAILISLMIFISLSAYISVPKYRKYLRFLFLLFVFNLIFTGSRGPLIAFFLGVVYLFVHNARISEKLIIGVSLLFCIVVISQTKLGEDYSSFFKSVFFIWDSSAGEEIQGSSVDGRIRQFMGVVNIVKEDSGTILFGKGKGFISDYFEKYGYGTDVLGFESIVFSTLVSHGVLGLFFIVFLKYLLMFLINKKYYKQCGFDSKYYYLINSFILVNIITSIIVGSVYELQFLLIYIVLLKIAVITKQGGIKNDHMPTMVYSCKK